MSLSIEAAEKYGRPWEEWKHAVHKIIRAVEFYTIRRGERVMKTANSCIRKLRSTGVGLSRKRICSREAAEGFETCNEQDHLDKRSHQNRLV